MTLALSRTASPTRHHLPSVVNTSALGRGSRAILGERSSRYVSTRGGRGLALSLWLCSCVPREATPRRASVNLAQVAEAPSTAIDAGDTVTAQLDEDARRSAADVRIAPSPRGAFGAWLVAGPFRGSLAVPPTGLDETVPPVAGTPALTKNPSPSKSRCWTIAASAEGSIDLRGALDTGAVERIAYAAGTIHLERAGTYLLLLGIDDGVRVSVDGRVIFSRDDPRPLRDDDDIVPLELPAGDHPILLKFHQRNGAWAFRARLVQHSLKPPVGAFLHLPGTSADDARALATKMSFVTLERSFDGAANPPHYVPTLTVRFPAGAPRGVPLAVRARFSGLGPSLPETSAAVPIGAAGVGELRLALASLAPFAAPLTIEANVAGATTQFAFTPQPLTEQAIVHAERALARTDGTRLKSGSLESVQYLTRRLSGLLSSGDTDAEAQALEARELDQLATALERGADPYDGRTGPMRRALRSSLDGAFSEFGLYVPPSYDEGGPRRHPMVVGLHGLNGFSMSALRWLFGLDDPHHDQRWEERHIGALPPSDAIVITPFAHGNSFYREFGETDVMHVVDWAQKRFSIDPARITITGPSMGGIGAAALPLHRPSTFAAAAPLCGYHSYFVRGHSGGREMQPWERFLAEERSNAFWAENGKQLPLWIVHGTKDLPEQNSGVLIERYEKLGFPIKHDHPDAGHNVWQQTYEGLKGVRWLTAQRRDLHPAHVRFKTTRTRWAKSDWVEVDELADEAHWAEVIAQANAVSKTIRSTTHGVAQLSFARDEKLFGMSPTTVIVDGQTLAFGETETLTFHRDPGSTTWTKGPRSHDGLFKHGTITGPIRDVFSEPLLFVYGGGEEEARANEQVARAFATVRPGVHIDYPIVSDTEFFARREALANDRSLFLVGRTNGVLAAIAREHPLPVRVESGVVVLGSQRLVGKQLGAAFVYPNPVRPDRYIVVVAGADVPGTLRAMSLPDLLPDFCVWDETLAPARGSLLLGAGSFRAAGFFTNEWRLPAATRDPNESR